MAQSERCGNPVCAAPLGAAVHVDKGNPYYHDFEYNPARAELGRLRAELEFAKVYVQRANKENERLQVRLDALENPACTCGHPWRDHTPAAEDCDEPCQTAECSCDMFDTHAVFARIMAEKDRETDGLRLENERLRDAIFAGLAPCLRTCDPVELLTEERRLAKSEHDELTRELEATKNQCDRLRRVIAEIGACLIRMDHDGSSRVVRQNLAITDIRAIIERETGK